MSVSSHPVDVRRDAGWLPEQEDLEDWLSGRSERAQSRGERPLHPVVAQFRDLIDTDPVVRLYLNQMISQVPANRQYSKRHLKSVDQNCNTLL